MLKTIKIKLTTKDIRHLLLALLKSNLQTIRAKKMKDLLTKILKEKTGNWWTL